MTRALRVRPLALTAGFGLAVGVRVLVGGSEVARSASAGLVFAALLFAMVATFVPRPSWPSRGGLVVGALGAAALSLPPLLRRLDGAAPHRPAGSFLAWALVVAVVAVAEETFLRGLLYSAVAEASGVLVAIALSAIEFGLLHVPLYGWRAAPLDVAVGIWLGLLRELTGGPAAPAAAHTLADLAGWWLR